MLALLEDDEEALAVVEAWRFRESRATRVVIRNLSEPNEIEIDEPEVEPVKVADYPRGQEEEPDSAPEHDDVEEEKPAQSEAMAAWEKASAGLDWKAKETSLEAVLDDAMALYKADANAGWNQLWDALHILGEYRSQAYKQQTVRILGWDEDLVQDFVVDAWKQIENGKWCGTGPFSHWVKTVHRNFANKRLNEITAERNRTEGLSPQPTKGEEAEKGYEKGYVYTEGVSIPLWQAAVRQEEDVTKALYRLSVADRVYSGFLKAGLNQKEAAQKMGESVPTSRKREQRIREALQGAGFAYADAAEEVPA